MRIMTKYRLLAEHQKAFDAHQERKKEAHGYEGINFWRKEKSEKKKHANFAIKNVRILERVHIFVISQWLQRGAIPH